ncbi:MAG: PASTA domain-containing protein [Thermosipho sp. (in: Bacteria)]|nr:PASTA domain-containing protein [Thermosipho sp. (in: thermotogales)]
MRTIEKEEFKIKIIKYFFIFLAGFAFGVLAFLGIIYFQSKANTAYIPDVLGFTVDEAKKILNDEGFNVITFGSGRVISTIPNVGIVVKKGRIIRVFGESIETNEYTLPDFFGTSYETVYNILTSWGLNVEVVKIKYPGPDGRVLATYPIAGEKISTGETIKLLVDNGEIGGS